MACEISTGRTLALIKGPVQSLNVPEGFVERTIPAHEGAGRKQDQIEDRNAERDTAVGRLSDEERQRRNHIQDQQAYVSCKNKRLSYE